MGDRIDFHMNILVVEGFLAMRNVLVSFLKDLGFKNVDAVEHETAVANKLQGKSYDLIIGHDVNGMSGLELLKKIRRGEFLVMSTEKKVSFILLSADSLKENVLRAIEAGTDGFIVVPVTAETLMGQIQKIAKKKKQFAAA